MTEQTVRMMAKEFAGAYFDSSKRSKEFREGKQTVKVSKWMTLVDPQGKKIRREVIFNVPFCVAFKTAEEYAASAWPHWVDYARQKLAEMLAKPDGVVHPHLKERIAAALIDDRERQLKQGGKRLRQLQGAEGENRNRGISRQG
jgi:hypothetical protein